MQNSCRTCMTQFSQTKTRGNSHKQSIFEKPKNCKKDANIMELLQEVQPQIKVECDDNLPKLMCFECIKNLLVSCTFLETYRNSDKNFREMLKEVNEMIVEIDHNVESSKNEKRRDSKITTNIDSENDAVEFVDEISYESGSKEQNIESSSSDSDWTISDESCHKEDLRNTSKSIQREVKIAVYDGEDEIELIKLPDQNEDGGLPCQECDAVLNNITLWRQHMRRNHLENIQKTKKINKPKRSKKLKCDYCDKVFPTTTRCKSHMRIHTDEKPYLCIECGKNFRGLSSLKIHMLRHKGEKNFECPQCPRKFVCASGLYNHEKIHSNDKPFVCETCGSSFRMKDDLKKHERCHKGIKNHKCDFCEMRFLTTEKQRRHMRTHTGEKPYRCQYCERAFAQSNDYIKHLRQHLGENVYQCELCPLRFPLVRDLRAHFVVHKDEDEETRARNLAARLEEQQKLEIKLGVAKKENPDKKIIK
ncbi:zinc finger protein 286A-like [Lucilia cuprina]|uniref:zinc finger protein 286A-like n=1 Tax=Lucilia cuprina TaxID=7375 RepID=UPI001F05D89A|nr:zinc finger protein 286A-like [Lucilia cuprina]